MIKIVSIITAFLTFFAGFFGIDLHFGTPELPAVTKENGIVFVQNLRYGDGERDYLDIAYPENATGETGLILDVHGGAWVAGSKDYETFYVKGAASWGYVGAAISYTYISETTHCDLILDEITMALRSIKDYAESVNINISKVIITGASAGGHLATLYAYSRGGESGVKPVAVLDNCGPTALEYLGDMKEMVTSGSLGSADTACALISYLCGEKVTLDNLDEPAVKDALEKVSATHYIDTAVPTIICHGLKDTVVPYKNAEILDKMLTEKGVRHDFITYPNSGHGLSDDPDCLNYTYQLLYQYANDYLK